jgi:hypothetical protein
LSKAEVLYLQGQKKVSGSYERKLKCLIRKKVENLKKELPLLSKTFPIDHLFNEGNRELKEKVEEKTLRKPILSISHAATKFSNPKVQNNESTIGCATEFSNAVSLEKQASTEYNIKIVSDEGLEGSDASTKRLDKHEINSKATENSSSSLNKKKISAGEGIRTLGTLRSQALCNLIPGLRPTRLGDPGLSLLTNRFL